MTPNEPPRGNRNRSLIIILVVALLLCCCCAVIALVATYGCYDFWTGIAPACSFEPFL